MPTTPQFRSTHFSLKDRIISFVSEKFFGSLTYTVRHGIIKGMKRKGGLGFLPAFLARSPENEPELTFLRNLDLEGKVVYDIGAFQGVMTLFFARQAKAVISYEPLPTNYRRVIENVELNGLRHVARPEPCIGQSERFFAPDRRPSHAGSRQRRSRRKRPDRGFCA